MEDLIGKRVKINPLAPAYSGFSGIIRELQGYKFKVEIVDFPGTFTFLDKGSFSLEDDGPKTKTFRIMGKDDEFKAEILKVVFTTDTGNRETTPETMTGGFLAEYQENPHKRTVKLFALNPHPVVIGLFGAHSITLYTTDGKHQEMLGEVMAVPDIF